MDFLSLFPMGSKGFFFLEVFMKLFTKRWRHMTTSAIE